MFLTLLFLLFMNFLPKKKAKSKHNRFFSFNVDKILCFAYHYDKISIHFIISNYTSKFHRIIFNGHKFFCKEKNDEMRQKNFFLVKFFDILKQKNFHVGGVQLTESNTLPKKTNALHYKVAESTTLPSEN